MLIDARELADDTSIEADVVIIGGGAAGITLAMEMEQRGLTTAILESGGLTATASTLDLYQGENVGLPYTFAGGCRSRYLGGSSNCWGGWCRPWDDWDFQQRNWINESGWPFGRAELDPYYDRARQLLKLGPNNHSVEHWVEAINRADVKGLDLDPKRAFHVLSQFSPPVRFGIDYREVLTRSQRIKVYLWSNVVDIETDNPAVNVRRLQVRTLEGKKLTARGQQYVLATGGIENARMLLAANKVQPAGLGNGNDLVGRYYADHPRLMFDSIDFAPQYRKNKLYDIKFHYQNDAVAANGTRISAQFGIATEVQQREGLLSSRAWFRSIFPGELSESVKALFRMKRRLSRMDEYGHTFGSDLAEIARHPWNSSRFVAARLFHLNSLIQDVKFEIIVEPEPNPSSRITLSNQRDALGMPRVKVDWQLTPLVRRTFERTADILGAELERAGIAKIKKDSPFTSEKYPADMEGTWHHMGSTRMHDSPRHGVVDRNCKIHEMNNFYVAGSSVFPTCGANYPTITLVALAVRLADHLAGRLAQPVATQPAVKLAVQAEG